MISSKGLNTLKNIADYCKDIIRDKDTYSFTYRKISVKDIDDLMAEIDHIVDANKKVEPKSCEHEWISNYLYSGTFCKNCGRDTKLPKQDKIEPLEKLSKDEITNVYLCLKHCEGEYYTKGVLNLIDITVIERIIERFNLQKFNGE